MSICNGDTDPMDLSIALSGLIAPKKVGAVIATYVKFMSISPIIKVGE